MIKKRRNLFIMLVVIVLMLSATVGVIVASSNGTRFNNTILASSVADVSSSGLLTVTNQYQGISGKTTKGEITTYIEKKTWGLFWKRVDIGEPNNEWYDVIYNYVYAGDHTFQLPSKGTYRITVVYVISGSGGAPDTITRTIKKTN